MSDQNNRPTTPHIDGNVNLNGKDVKASEASGNKHADVTITDTATIKGNWPSGLTDLIRSMANREAQAIVDEREARENVRANHRNLNRMLTLLGALVIGLVVTFILNSGVLGKWGPTFAPYAFTITIFLDSGLALYSYIRHY